MRIAEIATWGLIAVAGGSVLVNGIGEAGKDADDRQQVESSVYYHRCAEARAAGAAPIYRGEPGYRSPLDADNDGVACEPYRGY